MFQILKICTSNDLLIGTLVNEGREIKTCHNWIFFHVHGTDIILECTGVFSCTINQFFIWFEGPSLVFPRFLCRQICKIKHWSLWCLILVNLRQSIESTKKVFTTATAISSKRHRKRERNTLKEINGRFKTHHSRTHKQSCCQLVEKFPTNIAHPHNKRLNCNTDNALKLEFFSALEP